MSGGDKHPARAKVGRRNRWSRFQKKRCGKGKLGWTRMGRREEPRDVPLAFTVKAVSKGEAIVGEGRDRGRNPGLSHSGEQKVSFLMTRQAIQKQQDREGWVMGERLGRVVPNWQVSGWGKE